MPQVGSEEFAYTKDGMKAALQASRKSGKPMKIGKLGTPTAAPSDQADLAMPAPKPRKGIAKK